MRLLPSLLCLALFLARIYCEEVFGIVGENFTFPVKVDQKVVETIWKKNKDKVAEWEPLNKPTYFGPLYNRSVLMENGSLTIIDLKKADAGPYELEFWDSVKDYNLNFVLVVLDPLPEPTIVCNSSDHKLVLTCTADFQGPLSYTWKLNDNPQSHQEQELSIPLEDVNTTTKATCLVKFSQMERSSEISLSHCLPVENESSSYKRNRGALWAALVLVGALVLVAFLLWKGKINLRRGRTTAQNSAVNGSGEHEQLFHGDSQQQPTSQGGRGLNEEDSAPKGKHIVKNGVNQEEVTQDAEGGNGEHLNNSPSHSKEDLKSKVVAQTNMEEKR